MTVYNELKGVMSLHSKEDITTAMLKLRKRGREDRQALLNMQRDYHELVETIGLLPENTSHSEALKYAYDLRENRLGSENREVRTSIDDTDEPAPVAEG